MQKIKVELWIGGELEISEVVYPAELPGRLKMLRAKGQRSGLWWELFQYRASKLSAGRPTINESTIRKIQNAAPDELHTEVARRVGVHRCTVIKYRNAI